MIRAETAAEVTPDRSIDEGQCMALFTRFTSPRITTTEGSSRRAFLRSSGGYAAGAAALVGVPAAALLEATDAEAKVDRTTSPKAVPNPTTPVPDEPVMAFIQDAKAGTVVIMSGTSQRTVQDHVLVGKLTHTPKAKKTKAKKRRKPVTATDRRKGRR